MSYCVYWATSGVTGGAWGGLAGALEGSAGVLGSVGALKGPGLFDPRGSL